MKTPQAEDKATRKAVWMSAAWVVSTYFAEGFPYAVLNSLVEVLYRDLGATLAAVGLTSLFHLPWNLKFVWAPWMERRARMRSWIAWLEVGLGGGFLLVGSGLALLGEPALPAEGFVGLSVLFAVLALLSASHDVAIDAHYLEALGLQEQARYVGVRSGAYKVASIAARGPLLFAIHVFGWSAGLILIGVVHLGLSWAHSKWLLNETPSSVSPAAPPSIAPLELPTSASSESGRSLPPLSKTWGTSLGWLAVAGVALALLIPGSIRRTLGLSGGVSLGLAALVALALGIRNSPLKTRIVPEALTDLLGRPRMTSALLFVLTFRLGESFQQKMKWPFLSEVMGLSKADYSTLNGTLGVLAGFAGVFVGGALIAKFGLRRWFWPFVAAQNVLNLLYVLLALLPVAVPDAPRGDFRLWTGVVIVIDEWGSGLGNAVLMIYLMRLVSGEHRASEYAFVTALMSFGFTVAGATSGFFAAAIGYPGFFGLSFLLTVPMMVLAPRALRALRRDPVA